MFAGVPLINKTSRWVSQHLFLLTTPLVLIVVFQLLSRVWLFLTPWTAACQAHLSSAVPWSLQYTYWNLKKASCTYSEASEKIWMWCLHPALKVEAWHGNSRRLEHLKMKEQHGQKCGGRKPNENKWGTRDSSVWPEDGGSRRWA